ncbi:uncharacterized protein LOC126739991 [Anthonomus grandis grandis]|uniref:uncharacterized protein LOC126739991 n=1 Tax=Anthonomus grandis grandis TaxID=2921223 RepID=UPI002165612C|nr:uncharacterized protein LOC126739991 [Anthonomus grandis grandis]XP_050301793.1 uncharacterized protein LOC126739991 [Anthonomus grandis grandis]
MNIKEERRKSDNNPRDPISRIFHLRIFNEPVTIRFYEYADGPLACKLVVHEPMNIRNVIKAISMQEGILDYYKYVVTEYWKDYDAERILEEHELILNIKHDQMRSGYNFSFLFKKDFQKYKYLNRKSEYFVSYHAAEGILSKNTKDPGTIQTLEQKLYSIEKMTPYKTRLVIPPLEDPFTSKDELSDRPTFISMKEEATQRSKEKGSEYFESKLYSIHIFEDQCHNCNVIYCGTVYVGQQHSQTVVELKTLANKQEPMNWVKKYLLLRGQTLYFVETHEEMLRLYYMNWSEFDNLLILSKVKKEIGPQNIGSVEDYGFYKFRKARTYYNSPYQGCILMRQYYDVTQPIIKMMICPEPISKCEIDFPEYNSKGLDLWLAALKLAKHGKRIIDAYRSYLADLHDCEGNFHMADRVPMDFTQGFGRIVHNEEEIADILNEPKQMWGGQRFEHYETFPKDTLSHGKHLTQKYYHGDISRPETEKMLLATKTNGAWLLRDSHARTNCLTISYLYENRVHHKYVAAASHVDQSSKRRIYVVTLDQQLAFYDVHSLIEFYRLNKGKTMLCVLGQSVKKESQPDSTPPRNLVTLYSPVKTRGEPINLTKAEFLDHMVYNLADTDNKSPKSVKNFITNTWKSAFGRPKKSRTAPTSPNAELLSTFKVNLESEDNSTVSQSLEIPSTSGVSSLGTTTTPDSPPPSTSQPHSALLHHSGEFPNTDSHG